MNDNNPVGTFPNAEPSAANSAGSTRHETDRVRGAGRHGDALRRLLKWVLLVSLVLGAQLLPATARAQYATGGSGIYRGNILWFSWGADGAPIPQAGTTVTNTYSIAGVPLAVTCTLSGITSPGTDPDLISYRSGDWTGDGLDDLYNIGGTGTANALVVGLGNRLEGNVVDFGFNCSATLGGSPSPLGGLVFADAEQNGGNEFVRVTVPPGGVFRILEGTRTCSSRYQVVTNAAGTTYTTNSPDPVCSTGPMAVGYIEGASSGAVTVLGGGRSAVALGVMLNGADRGDAPASYGDAAHLLNPSWTGGTIPPNTTQDVFDAGFVRASLQPTGLRLGDSVDADPGNQPSANADADDASGTADEDGLVPGSLSLTAGTTTAQVTIRAVNPNATAATLAGWIDFNGSGTFDPSERVTVTVPANTNVATPFVLNWSGLAPIAGNLTTFARFRIATDGAQLASPTGLAADGEVEDYLVRSVSPQVSVTKTANPSGALTPGGTVVYTMTVTSTGPVSASGTVISDSLPAGIVSGTWTCAASAGAVCPSGAGTMPLNQTIATFPSGGAVAYTITATVAAAPPANVVNTASATPPPGGNCYPAGTAPPCTATVSNPPVPVVAMTKTTAATQALPGGTVTYTVTVDNTGNVAADGTTVSDAVPAGVGAVNWTCAASGGAACPAASGAGAINETLLTLPAGGQIVYTVVATIDPNPPASITNTASATVPGGGLCSTGSAPPCTSTVTLTTAPQVGIVKTANPTGSIAPGGSVTYTITVSNGGSTPAPATQVFDGFPAGIASATWTCTAGGGAVCPNASSPGVVTPPADLLNQTILTFPPGGVVTYTIIATAAASLPPAVVNTASATPPGGVCLPANTAPPCSTSVSNPPAPVISVGKTANTGQLVPGSTVTYTVTVANTGSVGANGSVITDPIPTGLTVPMNWACTGAGGAACPTTSGTGALNETIATFPAGGTLTYAITATVDANPPASVANVVSVTPPAGGICADGSTVPCAGTSVVPVAPRLSLTKTASPVMAQPGGTVTYTLIASNVGSGAADGTLVVDPLPAGIVSATWTCAAAGGATCASPAGSGALNQVIAVFPAGGSVTYTITATVSANPPAAVTNTATATPPSGGVCAPGNTPSPCNATVSNASAPQVAITKTSNVAGALTPGGTVTYTVTATDSGPVAAPGTLISDPLPAGITAFAWACTATGGAVCPAGSGSGALNQTIAVFPPGGVVTYTITATVSASPPASVSNTATATPPSGGLCLPGNTPPPCSATVTNGVTPVADVSIVKSGPADVASGSNISYTLVVSNAGPDAASNVVIDDPTPAGLIFVSNSGACTTPFPCSLGALPAGASVTITSTFGVPADYAGPDPIVNTASVSSATFDPNSGNNTGTSTATRTPRFSVPPRPVPLDATWAMVGLAALLVWSAGRRSRRRLR